MVMLLLLDGRSWWQRLGTCCAVPSGERMRIFSERVYVPVLTAVPWRQAQEYCRSNYTDLATIPDSAAYDLIYSLTPADPFWIGLFRDPWEWENGDQSSFRQWADGQPGNVSNEGCAGVDGSGLWRALSCALNLPFVCQIGGERISSIVTQYP
uniref:C-type lectin domain-containing protein n=1 Tax=Denticeps clupeoides TaxID=299321 RepID=A0AAY4C0Z8_9TELE